MDFLKTHIVKFSLIAVLGVWFVLFSHYRYWQNPENVFQHDVSAYYIYLPALFIFQDAEFQFMETIESDPIRENTQLYTSQSGKTMSKMSIGMAISYTPFFGIAYVHSLILSSPIDGYSTIFSFWISIGGLLFGWLGLLVLSKILHSYFNNYYVAFGILAIGLGTNLLFYSTIESAMSHSVSFFLFSCGLYLSLKWRKSIHIQTSILLGITLACIVLVRPVNIFYVLLLLLIDVKNLSSVIKKANASIPALFALILSGLLITSIQLIYWKLKTGSFLYFAYQDEGFDFLNPHLLEILVGFRKGWLIYTPIMIFGVMGMCLRSFRQSIFFPAIPIVLFIQLYVLSSWWCWWYGGSFGFRPIIEFYGIMAIPLLYFVRYLYQSSLKWLLLLPLLLIDLNIFQNHQYIYRAIHWDAMTWQAYKKSFFKKLPPADFEQYLDPPDYQLPGEENH